MGLSQLPQVKDGEMEDYMHKSRKVREKITDSFGKPYSQQGKLRKPQNIKTLLKHYMFTFGVACAACKF